MCVHVCGHDCSTAFGGCIRCVPPSIGLISNRQRLPLPWSDACSCCKLHKTHDNNNEPLIVSAALMKCFVQWTRKQNYTRPQCIRWFLGFAVTPKFQNGQQLHRNSTQNHLKWTFKRPHQKQGEHQKKKINSRPKMKQNQWRPITTESNASIHRNPLGERVLRVQCTDGASISKYYS